MFFCFFLIAYILSRINFKMALIFIYCNFCITTPCKCIIVICNCKSYYYCVVGNARFCLQNILGERAICGEAVLYFFNSWFVGDIDDRKVKSMKSSRIHKSCELNPGPSACL